MGSSQKPGNKAQYAIDSVHFFFRLGAIRDGSFETVLPHQRAEPGDDHQTSCCTTCHRWVGRTSIRSRLPLVQHLQFRSRKLQDLLLHACLSVSNRMTGSGLTCCLLTGVTKYLRLQNVAPFPDLPEGVNNHLVFPCVLAFQKDIPTFRAGPVPGRNPCLFGPGPGTNRCVSSPADRILIHQGL